jgi:hypothetical protein
MRSVESNIIQSEDLHVRRISGFLLEAVLFAIAIPAYAAGLMLWKLGVRTTRR